MRHFVLPVPVLARTGTRTMQPGRAVLRRCRGAGLEPEHAQRLGQLRRLLGQRLGRGRRLLDQRGVLLRHSVHAADGLADLFDACRLLLSGGADRAHDELDLAHRLQHRGVVAPAEALRCARLRTSLATTAKPRPCSPARAASTAALSARILVWKAMPSMTAMMSTIFAAEA